MATDSNRPVNKMPKRVSKTTTPVEIITITGCSSKLKMLISIKCTEYSKQTETFHTSIGKNLPIKFIVSANEAQNKKLYIIAVPYYLEEDSMTYKKVKMCEDHAQVKSKKNPFYQHFIRCNHKEKDYFTKNGVLKKRNEFLGVLIPFSHFETDPVKEETHISANFSFMCTNFCALDKKKKTIQVFFTLQDKEKKNILDHCIINLCVYKKDKNIAEPQQTDPTTDQSPNQTTALPTRLTDSKPSISNTSFQINKTDREDPQTEEVLPDTPTLQQIDSLDAGPSTSKTAPECTQKEVLTQLTESNKTDIFPININVIGKENYKILLKIYQGLIANDIIKLEAEKQDATLYLNGISEIEELLKTLTLE